jgi:hypothetical protein
MDEEKIIYQIEVDTKAVDLAFSQLNKKAEDLQANLSGMKVGSDSFKALSKDINATAQASTALATAVKTNATALGAVSTAAKSAEGSIAALRERQKQLQKDFEATKIGSEEYKKLQKELVEVNKDLKLATDSAKAQQNALGGVNEATEFAVGSYGELRQRIKALKAEQDRLVVGSEDFIRNQAQLNVALQDEIDIRSKQPSLFKERIKAAIDESSALKGVAGALAGNNSAIGGAVNGLKNLKDGLGIASKGFGTLKLAISSTGITLIIGAFQALLAYFQKTDDGSEKLERAMAQIGAVTDVLVGKLIAFGKFLVEAFETPKETIQQLGDSIKTYVLDRFEMLTKGIFGVGKAFTQLFAGEFSAAAKTAAESLKGIGTAIVPIDLIEKGARAAAAGLRSIADEASRAADAAAELKRQQQELDDVERALSVLNAKREGEISRLIIASKDRTKTDAERLAILDRIGQIEIEQSKETIDLASTKLDFIKRENSAKEAAGQLTDDLKDKEAAGIIEVQRLINSSLETREKVANRRKILEEEIAADSLKRAEKEAEDRLKLEEEYNKRVQEEFENTEGYINELFGERQLAQKQRFSEGLDSEEEYAELSLEIEQGRLSALVTAYEDYGKSTMDLRNQIADNEIAAAQKEKKETQKAEKDKQTARMATMDLASNVFSALSGLAEENSATAKALAITAATIDTISATIKAYQAGLTLTAPAPAPQIFAVVSAAAAAAFGAANIAKIANAEKGGVVWEKAERGKMFRLGGQPHSNGGTKFVGSDGTRFEAERGEILAVVNKRSSSMIKNLSDLNVMGGGIKFAPSNYMADGGLVDTTLTNNALASLNNVDIPEPGRPVVSVKSIRKVNNQVEVVQSKKSLG